MKLDFWTKSQQPPGQEDRAAGYTGDAITALIGSVSGTAAQPAATAAVETCTRAISLPFGLAAVEGDRGLYGPSQLIAAVRDLMRTGNHVGLLDVVDGQLQVLPVSDYQVTGSAQRPIYELELARPDGRKSQRVVLGEQVVHLRVNADSSEPWRGVAPWRSARLTADTLGLIERSLSYDAAAPVGYVMPMPDGAPGRVATQAKNALTTGKGGVSLIETTAGGLGAGAVNAPRRDWEQKRFGGEVPEANLATRDSTATAILGAYGVHTALLSGDGAAQDRARRMLYLDVIEPLAAMMVVELSLKLGSMVTLSFGQSQYQDHARLSRALASYIGVGVPYSEAVALLGLDLSGTRTAPARPGVADRGDEPTTWEEYPPHVPETRA